ncbi:hypothetical protein R2F61_00835 [Mollicutes bacterium LVI A0078]|nr:hypothetical protein RZE84_00835 [Mollicutes bacterium LVI A0075]WOO91126.1 hypothetical protein R2F61_00835 [Mollicutes bacterium LVI A0078]
MPSIAFSAAEGRSYNMCSTSSNCYIYSNHGIYNRFTTIGSYITSTLTQKDNSAGGSSTAQVTYGGGGQELGSTISYYTGNLSYNGDSIYTYNYQGEQGVTYAATGISSVSSSNKFLANVKYEQL